MLDKDDWDRLAKRALHCIESGEREFYDNSCEFPASTYTDEDRWKREVEFIFKRKPVVLAFSSELAEPNSYMAMERIGVPILLTRGSDGEVRGFLNICRHRGAVLTGEVEACGVAKRFVCPYHSWTFDNSGGLVGLPGKAEFGDVPDRFTHLVSISVTERAGLIWGILTPGVELDVDSFLGDMLPKLEKVGLDKFKVFGRHTLHGGNWKVAMDGYFENYHFMGLHKNSFGQTIMSDFALFEDLGPHCEYAFIKPEICELREQPQSEWKANSLIQLAQYIFPNFVGAHRLDEDPYKEPYVFFQIWPGDAPGKSITHIVALTPQLEWSEDDDRMLKEFLDFIITVVDGEDYWLTRNIQRGLSSMANQNFIFGRMERLCQHYQKTVDMLISEADSRITIAAE